MHFQVITLFPEMIQAAMNTSIIGRAVKNGIIGIDTVDLKNFPPTVTALLMIILMAAEQGC